MSVTFAQGFSAAGVEAGISATPGKKDVALVVNEGPLTAAAGVFTTNRFCAAPVQWSRKAVADGSLKAVILNSGGANACTGKAGYAQSVATAHEVAGLLGTEDGEVAVCSTGLIGELLPLDKVLDGAARAFAALEPTMAAGEDASHAIMTTDTKPKTVTRMGSNGFRVGGMVKGSGMIAPQLATMLCVITTDAVVSAGQLQAALGAAVDTSFNRIDVDGCMSTNDTVLLLASGASGIEPDPDEFNDLIANCCASLARQIIGDGEGASHDIRITVAGATSETPRWRAGARSPRQTCSNARSAATTPTGAHRELFGHRAGGRGALRPRRGDCRRQRRAHLRRRQTGPRPQRGRHDATPDRHRRGPACGYVGRNRVDRRPDPRICAYQRGLRELRTWQKN